MVTNNVPFSVSTISPLPRFLPNPLPMGLPLVPNSGYEYQFHPGHPGHPAPGFNLQENMEAWRSYLSRSSSMCGGYHGAVLAGHPMLQNGMHMSASRKIAAQEATAILKAWLNDHLSNPYPNRTEKLILACMTDMTLTQVSTWFANARRRLKKENRVTWSSKNVRDEDDKDCEEGASKDKENESDSDIDIDDSTSDNSKRVKCNESSQSDSGGSSVIIPSVGPRGQPLTPSDLFTIIRIMAPTL